MHIHGAIRVGSIVVFLFSPALMVGGCPTTDTQIPSDIVGDATAGQQKFSEACASCHSTGAIASARNRITNNLGTISYSMSGITLTDQEIADLRAFLAQ